MRARTLGIVLLSDTHELHRELQVPEGELLLHAGDFTMLSRSMWAVSDFNEWLGELPHRCITTCGNHEYFFKADPSKRSMISNATVLINEGIEVNGLKIWGSPVTALYGGAFGLGLAEDRRRLYAEIPAGTDIIISHGLPYGILDGPPGSNQHAGCRELLRAILRVRPKLVLCGHIHSAAGMCDLGGITFVNAALLGADGDLAGSPIVIRMTSQ